MGFTAHNYSGFISCSGPFGGKQSGGNNPDQIQTETSAGSSAGECGFEQHRPAVVGDSARILVSPPTRPTNAQFRR